MKKLSIDQCLTQEEILDLLFQHVSNHGKIYKKFKTTLIRPGLSGERVDTIVDSGLETTKIVKEGEFVVRARTTAQEEYVITPVKFHTRYELCDDYVSEEELKLGFRAYKPTGKIKAIKAKEIMDGDEVFFTASWSEKMKLQSEDMLALPLGLEDELYRIAWAEFLQTYKEDTI